MLHKDQVRQELKLQKGEAAKLDEALRPVKEKYQPEVQHLRKLSADEAQGEYKDFKKAIRAESLKVIEGALRPERDARRLRWSPCRRARWGLALVAKLTTHRSGRNG